MDKKNVVFSHVNVILRCQECGHSWGYAVELERLGDLLDVPKRFRVCSICGSEIGGIEERSYEQQPSYQR